MFRKSIIIVALFIGLPLFASETIPMSAELPKIYMHLPLKDQIERYRKVYANVERIGPKPVYLQHVPELFPILENAIGLTYTFLTESRLHDESDTQNALQYLENIWTAAKNDLFKRTFNNVVFTNHIGALAVLISSYKEEVDQKAVYEGLPKQCGLIFSLFANPDPTKLKRGLSSDHVLEQYFHEQGAAGLAVFDIHSNAKETPTKKKPHFSLYEGTFKFYVHDLSHHFFYVNSNIKSKYAVFKALYEKSKLLEQEGRSHDATTIKGGIFLILHEQLVNNLSSNSNFKTIVAAIRERILDYVETFHGTIEYKQNGRDWEFVLREREGTLKTELKKAYVCFWDRFLSLANEELQFQEDSNVLSF